jgi:hypothetical protein
MVRWSTIGVCRSEGAQGVSLSCITDIAIFNKAPPHSPLPDIIASRVGWTRRSDRAAGVYRGGGIAGRRGRCRGTWKLSWMS